MKKHFTFFFLGLVCCITAQAQTSFPYYTGFDNSTETSGWATYRKGSTANSSWSVATTGGFSPAKCITHYYPVGGNVETDDWHVSPGLDFSSGGSLDSVRASFSGFGTPNNNDLVAIYLLRGSQDPSLGPSDTMLINFVGSNYTADNVWRMFGPVTIPPTPGISYIAFRYRTTINWLDVKFDNLALSMNTGTGIHESAGKKLVVYPNPASKGQSIRFMMDATATEPYVLNIFNSMGQCIETMEIKSNEELTAAYSAGMYFYSLSKNGEPAGSGKFIVQ